MPTSGKPVHILDALCLASERCGGRTRLDVLLSISRGDADVTTIADRLDIYPSQVSRALRAFLRDGLAVCVSRGRHRFYSAGPRVERSPLPRGGARFAYHFADGAVVAFEVDAAGLGAIDARLGIPRGAPGPSPSSTLEPKGDAAPAPMAGAPGPPHPTIGPG